MATSISIDQAYELVASEEPLNGKGFGVLGSIARLAATEDTANDARDLLIRLLEKRNTLSDTEQPLLDSLVSRLGLYPYVSNTDWLTGAEQVAFEYHRPAALAPENFVFHAMQQEIYQRLLKGESIVLSAPTSFGKSAITDALVASRQWQKIAIVVPTLALIDETRRRLARFSSIYKINTFPGQLATERTLFIMTQERLLEIEPFPEIDLFIIDEFYKLDSDLDPERGSLLNIAWDRLKRTGAQYYLTGPNVSGLSETLPQSLRESLTVTEFRTVAVDLVLVSRGESEQERVIEICREISGQTLIYCRTPARVREVGKWLLEAGIGSSTPQNQMAASWISDNYDAAWITAKCLSAGIGLHHARIPRAMQHHMVRMFNSGELKFLICTSTLIEGVNTSARNVLVVDNVLNRRPLDYFTFSNIRGRAGRMFRHFVGRVYLFGTSPEAVQTTIDIPISSQSSKASPATLLQIPDEELSPEARHRIQKYYQQNILSIETLRANKGIDPDRQISLAEEIASNPRWWNERLAWSGIPEYDQLLGVCELMINHLVHHSQRGRVTARSLATRINIVRRAQGSIPEMVAAQLQFNDNDRDEAVEDVLFFNRNWMGHIFPRSLLAIEVIQREVFRRYGLRAGNYSFYAPQVEGQFLPPYFVTLEEYGLPTVIALKLKDVGLFGESLDEVLTRLRIVAANPVVAEILGSFEQEILDEVVAGLGIEAPMWFTP